MLKTVLILMLPALATAQSPAAAPAEPPRVYQSSPVTPEQFAVMLDSAAAAAARVPSDPKKAKKFDPLKVFRRTVFDSYRDLTGQSYRAEDFSHMKPALAVQMYEREIAVFGKPQSYFNRGLARFRQGDYPAAASDFDLTASTEPAFGEGRAFYMAGVCHALQAARSLNSDPAAARAFDEGAVVRFSSAAAVNPANPFAYLSRAESWARLGEFKKAAADMDLYAANSEDRRHRRDTARGPLCELLRSKKLYPEGCRVPPAKKR